MPRRRVLTDAQLESLFALPTDDFRLIQHYTLTAEDIAIVVRRRRPHNRLGFAVQLCALRYPGRLIRPGEPIPLEVVRFVGQQLDIDPDDLALYATRAPTRYEQIDTLRELFGFRSLTQPDHQALSAWLLPIALTTVSGVTVAETLMSELRRRKIAAPGTSVIERMVAAALLQAERQVADFLTRGLSDTQRAGLDALLTIHEGTTVSNLSWARQGPGALGHRSLDRLIEQLTYLRAVGLPTTMTDPVHADRVRQLAREGARLTAQHLAALSVIRRRATLVATVLDTIPRLTDEAIGIFDRLFGRLFRRAERRASESLQRDARTINDKIRLFTKIGDALIEAKASGGDAFTAVGNVISWEKFAETIAEAKGLVRSEGPDYLALAERNHSVLRRVGPSFLAAFEFEGVEAAANILKAISSLREFYAGNRRTLPKELPTGFVKRAWREAVMRGKEVHGPAYELCAFVELRDRLRAGDVWVTGSRQYRAVEDQLIARPVFDAMREAGPLPIAVATDFATYIEDRRNLLRQRLDQVASKAATDSLVDVRIQGAVLKITPLPPVTPEAADKLADRLYGMLPQIRITDLLEEVAGWTGMIDCFPHLHTGLPTETPRILLTSLLADATNMGFTRMADACSIATYKQLVWTAGWHLREDNHADALTTLVEAQQAHPLAAMFGNATSSSSDGQHFPLGGRAETAGDVNPHKGSEPSMSIYTHLSSRFAPYYSNVISTTEGEAPYVLDGLLRHGTDMEIAVHHTDGGGVSDHVFGLCHLLGFRFAPRIPNLNDRRLYTFDSAAKWPSLEPFIGGRIDEKLIESHWDDVLRLATSIRTGVVSASLMLKRLGSYPRQNGLALALREVGRIERTLLTLDWLEDPELRRQATTELNKGESRNALSRAVCFHRLGRIRDQTYENRKHRASSLNLVVAAIILWNTVYLGRAIDALRDQGESVPDDLLAHLAPLGWQHINLTGDYLWGPSHQFGSPTYRPLRLQRSDGLAA